MADDLDFGGADGTLVLIGGYRAGVSTPLIVSNATWAFDAGGWVNLTGNYFGQSYPSEGRYSASMFWDPQTGWLYLYGGFPGLGQSVLDELWATDELVWENDSGWALPSGPPTASATMSGAELDGAADQPPLLVGESPLSPGAESQLWAFERKMNSSISISPNPGETNATIGFSSDTLGGVDPTAEWSFGDGENASGGNATHSFSRSGNYSVWLNLTDISGVQQATLTQLSIYPLAATINVPSHADVGENVSLSVLPSSGQAPFTADWSLPNGTSLSGLDVSYAFLTQGDIRLSVTLRDATGSAVTLGGRVTVSPALEANVSGVPSAVDVGVPLQLRSIVTGGTPPYELRWSLPSGRTSGSANVTFTPETQGSSVVDFEATDAAGGVWAGQWMLNVSPSLQGSASASSGSFFSGRTLSFHSSVSGGTPPYAWSWRFGDGGSAQTSDPTHTYAASGVYVVNVWVNDSGGGIFHQEFAARVPRTSGGLIWEVASDPLWIRLTILAGGAASVALITAALISRRR